jgi:hypothetical protein
VSNQRLTWIFVAFWRSTQHYGLIAKAGCKIAHVALNNKQAYNQCKLTDGTVSCLWAEVLINAKKRGDEIGSENVAMQLDTNYHSYINLHKMNFVFEHCVF